MPDNDATTVRGEVHMSDEIDTHIGSSHRTFMVTRRKNGSVTCHPMAKFYADQTPYLNMYASKGALLHGHAEALGEGAEGIASTLEAIPDPVEPGRTGDWAILSVGLDDSTSFSFDKIQGRYHDRQVTI
jgi:hypothetical protein